MDVDEALQIATPGDEVEREDIRDPILSKIREICGWRSPTFPGSQPVSLTRTNMRNLFPIPYVACEKTDGVRYLLYIASKRVWLIDRKEIVQTLGIHIPKRFALDEPQQGTLLDGELVTDVVKRTTEEGLIVTERVARYLIYDGIAIDGLSIASSNLLERLRCLYQGVVTPRLEWEQKYPEKVKEEKEKKQYLEIYLKDFFEVWDIAAISNFSKRLPHLSDGIIFTPVTMPYVPGTCRQLLKWKPPHLNSVDFYAEIITADQVVGGGVKGGDPLPVGVRLFVGNRGIRVFTGLWLALVGDKCKELLTKFQNGIPHISNTIWECYYDFETTTKSPQVIISDDRETFDFKNGEETSGGWCVERIRTDKTTPNDERVVNSVFESICDGVSFEELIAAFQEYREDGKAAASESCELPTYYKSHGSAAIVTSPRRTPKLQCQ